LLAERAADFVDIFIRRNVAELREIKLEEHMVPVRHTARERALYLAEAHDAEEIARAREGTGMLDPSGLNIGVPGFHNRRRTETVERLLKLCSHFQLSGVRGASANAAEECDRIYEVKDRRVHAARTHVSRCLRAIRLLEEVRWCQLGGLEQNQDANPWRAGPRCAMEVLLRAGGPREREAATYLQGEWRASLAENPDSIPAALERHRPRDPELAHLLGINASGAARARGTSLEARWRGLMAQHLKLEVLNRLLQVQGREVEELLQELVLALKSFDFFSRTVRLLKEDPKERCCLVCLEEDLPLPRLAITPCAHIFCHDCLRAQVAKFGACSVCRTKLPTGSVVPLTLEIEAAEKPRAVTNTPYACGSMYDLPAEPSLQSASLASSDPGLREEAQEFRKYGTKLATLVRTLYTLRQNDSEAKVIVFLQFDDLKLKIADALREFQVPVVLLQGTVNHRCNTIREWQTNATSEQFVLLLSLQQSASGTNLTAANHVIFVHPMLAESSERAMSYEMQAIGRARRHGQKRDTVHVWRLVTADTLEEDITKRHRPELWNIQEPVETLAHPTASVAEAAPVEPAWPPPVMPRPWRPHDG